MKLKVQKEVATDAQGRRVWPVVNEMGITVETTTTRDLARKFIAKHKSDKKLELATQS